MQSDLAPSADQVTIGRLRKKITKLLQQRDNFAKQLTHYQHVLSMQPHLTTRYEAYEKLKAERERVKALEKRVKEQELLIKLLTEKKDEAGFWK